MEKTVQTWLHRTGAMVKVFNTDDSGDHLLPEGTFNVLWYSGYGDILQQTTEDYTLPQRLPGMGYDLVDTQVIEARDINAISIRESYSEPWYMAGVPEAELDDHGWPSSDGTHSFQGAELRYLQGKRQSGSTSEHKTLQLVSGEWPSDEELIQRYGGSWGGNVSNTDDPNIKVVMAYYESRGRKQVLELANIGGSQIELVGSHFGSWGSVEYVRLRLVSGAWPDPSELGSWLAIGKSYRIEPTDSENEVTMVIESTARNPMKRKTTKGIHEARVYSPYAGTGEVLYYTYQEGPPSNREFDEPTPSFKQAKANAKRAKAEKGLDWVGLIAYLDNGAREMVWATDKTQVAGDVSFTESKRGLTESPLYNEVRPALFTGVLDEDGVFEIKFFAHNGMSYTISSELSFPEMCNKVESYLIRAEGKGQIIQGIEETGNTVRVEVGYEGSGVGDDEGVLFIQIDPNYAGCESCGEYVRASEIYNDDFGFASCEYCRQNPGRDFEESQDSMLSMIQATVHSKTRPVTERTFEFGDAKMRGRDLKETALDNPDCPACGGSSVFTGKGNSYGAFLGSGDTWSLDWFECLRCKERFSTPISREPGQRYTVSKQDVYDYESIRRSGKAGLKEDAADAKTIRQALKAELELTNFNVSVTSNSFSGGSSVHVKIKDPAVKVADVKKVASRIDQATYDAYGDYWTGGTYLSVDYASDVVNGIAYLWTSAIEKKLGNTEDGYFNLNGMQIQRKGNKYLIFDQENLNGEGTGRLYGNGQIYSADEAGHTIAGYLLDYGYNERAFPGFLEGRRTKGYKLLKEEYDALYPDQSVIPGFETKFRPITPLDVLRSLPSDPSFQEVKDKFKSVGYGLDAGDYIEHGYADFNMDIVWSVEDNQGWKKALFLHPDGTYLYGDMDYGQFLITPLAESKRK